jgi:hypothetical protein
MLNEVQMYFGSTDGVNPGETLDLYIYEDTDGDGDPGTGAVYLGKENGVTVQALDSWSVYPLGTPVLLNGPGDVLIAAVNRTAGTDVDEFPAALDQTASQMRSWVGIYAAGNPGDPPTLPADSSWGIIDTFGFAGNWMLRGYGETGTGIVWIDVPWVSEVPDAGTTPADDVFDVDVIFDSTGLTAGECYTASLGLLHDDPGWASPAMVPLTMCIEAAPICTDVTGVELTLVTAGPIYPNDTVSFDADIAPDDADKPYNFEIDYGDGTPPETGSSSADPRAFDHSYTLPGTYTVAISIWNCEMAVPASDEVEVVVMEPEAPMFYIYLPIVNRDS